MAASMVRCRSCFSLQNYGYTFIRNASSKAYYVLLPEIPPDTPETNPILRVHDYPQFSSLSPDQTVTGCAKLAIQFDVQLGKHVEDLKDPNFPKSFTNVFEPIERISVPLNYAWRTAKNLSYVAGSSGYRDAFQRIHPQVERAKNEKWISHPLYNAIKEVGADHANLGEQELRLVEMYLLEARLNGIELTSNKKKEFLEVLGKVVDAKNHFRNRVLLTHNLFSHTIDDFGQVVDLPKSLVAQMAADKLNPSRGPWKVNLNQSQYGPFLEHCSHRLLRWNLWQAYNNRAAFTMDDKNLSNHNVIKDLRQYRKDLAQCLGYANFAELSMETKMAGNVENVLNMIESLKRHYRPLADEEITRLQEFAQSYGFTSKLEMWDIPYWRRRQREHLFAVDQNELAEYFPLPTVLDGMFKLCRDLFGVEFKDCTGEVEAWNEDVRFYRLIDVKGGHQIAAMYFDPYARPAQKLIGGSWVEAGREHSQLMETMPLSFMNLNLARPFSGRPSLLTMEDLGMAFYEFGHALQQLLTTVPYSEIAGQRNVEWDALHTCAMVMTQIGFNPHTLRALSGHFETGEAVPQHLIDSALQVRRHLSAFDIMKQLYYSAYDMEMYISDEHWLRTMQEVWPEFIPVPLSDDDNHPCSLTAIFSDQYPAAYYSFTWSQMIAADVYKSFDEVGFEDRAKLSAVGSRYRDTFLALGGGVSSNEVFRRFRGRDPTQDAMFAYHGNGK